jgi:hypothetical protein
LAEPTVQTPSQPGAPFRVGETIAFFPAVFGPTLPWLRMGLAVIDDIDAEAESVGFHFTEGDGQPYGQGMENIVRPTAAYWAWRRVWEAEYARTGDDAAADRVSEVLRLQVLLEHPIHGHDHE